MRIDRAPATVIVCVRVPEGTTREAFAGWADVAARAGTPVTWAARPADLATVLAVLGLKAAAWDIALAVDPPHLEARPTLRSEIASARAIAGRVECVVASGTPALAHRPLLVEQGIHTIAVGGFDAVTRSSRRPPPTGWPCRSVVWGLWEVRTVPRPPRSVLGRVLPWAAAMRLGDGSLTVVHVDAETTGDRLARVQFERLAGGLARRRSDVRTARLSDLPALLRAASQPEAGSVLKR
ncbi:MAG: hypothetical protein ACKOB1_03105, partial [Planctomycetia bacterium]